MWGTDGVRVFTVDDGWGWIFTAVEHWNAECVGWHVCKRGDRFAALQPISMGLAGLYGSTAAGAARGLALRMDHGSQYLSDHFTNQIKFWGIPVAKIVLLGIATHVVERQDGDRRSGRQYKHGIVFECCLTGRLGVLPGREAGDRHDDHCRGGSDYSEAGSPVGRAMGGGCRCVGDHTIGTHRFGDILDIVRADVLECDIDLTLDLQIYRLGQADAAGIGHAFEARGDVNAVAVKCAVVFGDHVAQIEADTEMHLPVFGELTVAAGKLLLNIDRRAQRFHRTGELGQQVVAR